MHAVAATALLLTGGLLVVAATLGIGVGLAVGVGARRALAPGTRRALAASLALVSLGAAMAVGWTLSGRYLGPLDYLGQVYGLLVPLQAVLAVAGALGGAR